MTRLGSLKRQLESFRADGALRRDTTMPRLTEVFLDRSRHNLETGHVLFNLSKNPEVKGAVGIREGFECFDWVIIAGYYAMYHAALALLSTKSLKSKNHAATVLALEYYFVHKQELGKEDLKRLKQAQLRKEDTTKLRAARNRRETAQYDAEEALRKREAEHVLRDATDFVNKISSMMDA